MLSRAQCPTGAHRIPLSSPGTPRVGGNTRSDRGVTHIMRPGGCEKRENERKKENRPGVDEALFRRGCLRIKIHVCFFVFFFDDFQCGI